MARISRVVASGYPHHVTQHGVQSIPIFQTDRDRQAYLQRANCEDGGSAEPVYLLRGVRGRLSRLRVGKFPRMPPVEREPRAAERSGELVELGKADTETET